MYQKIKITPEEEELKMLELLLDMKPFQNFKAVSRDEYFITADHCKILDDAKINYEKIHL